MSGSAESRPPPGGADVQAAFCAVLCDEWARAGVTDAVVAPGSRSTPMLAALDAEPRIRVTVVLDERSAGFVALGMGLAAGRPSVVVTTSGTASVELHPAMVEAGQAGVPLIAVTTDRPPELHHVGAPQTVEQAGLFGPVVRWAADPGVPDAGAAGMWRSLAARAVAEALSAPAGPGPVHLNLAFREPLLGAPERFPAPPGRPSGEPWHRAGARSWGGPPAPEIVELLQDFAGRRGLIVAGGGEGPAGDGSAVLAVAAALGWPVLADPRSGARVPSAWVVSAPDAIMRDRAAVDTLGTPDVVLRIGAPWASKVVNQWLAGLPPDVPQVLVDPWGRWADPERRASHLLSTTSTALAGALSGAKQSRWAERWRLADAAASSSIDMLLAPGGELEMSEPAVARAALAAVPSGGTLLVSSSMPVRDVEWYGAPRRDALVLANRGANGIDGVLSTAIGVAIATAAPTVALLGDLAFLYDAGALLWAAERDVQLSVLVIDNDGGGIFSFLPQAASLPPERFERYWGTPHRLDLAALAGAYGLEATTISDRAGLDAFLAGEAGAPGRSARGGSAGRPGVRLGVVRSERADNVAAHDRIHAVVAEAVGEALAASAAAGPSDGC